ncbi:ATP binding protein [hydrothermal vent metagenome]|uniref:ATP binding protein n=1 Tax=hydrothermal vent metagenome TaxID=652676 RepID=A0A1W1BGD4_9ZZZZ
MDYTSGFVNPIRLLEFLDLEKNLDPKKDDEITKIQQDFINTINSFLEGFELKAEDKNYFFQKEGYEDRLGLEELSEGYRGNVLIITDILIRIFGVGETVDTIEGIILIDEFDKHLHPKWQSRLVNQLTKTFPKIQFIMTTHNPMSILDREPDEITILKEIDGEIVAVKKRVGTKKIGVSTILLEYFGVESTVSDTMRYKIDEFTKLKLKDELTEDEKKRLDELEEFLDETVATNFIYNRAYYKFLKFLKENKQIDFESYEEMTDEEMESLLDEFKDLFE